MRVIDNIQRRVEGNETLLAWSFLLPGLTVMAIFVFWPIIFSIPLAFAEWDLLSDIKFVGFDNFKELLSDDYFKTALKNSFKYILIVPLIQFLAIILAILVNQSLKGMKFFRTCYYIPVITSAVAVSLVWTWLYKKEGLINHLLMEMGLIETGVDFLNDARIAIYSVMFVTVWKGLGYYMMIYLAGLQSIPNTLKEAARIDGANKWQTTRFIIIPLLKPYIFFCSLLSLMAALKVFDEIFIMTGGGPGISSLTSSVFIYNNGFKELRYGYASAAGLILSGIILIFSVIMFKFNKKNDI